MAFKFDSEYARVTSVHAPCEMRRRVQSMIKLRIDTDAVLVEGLIIIRRVKRLGHVCKDNQTTRRFRCTQRIGRAWMNHVVTAKRCAENCLLRSTPIALTARTTAPRFHQEAMQFIVRHPKHLLDQENAPFRRHVSSQCSSCDRHVIYSQNLCKYSEGSLRPMKHHHQSLSATPPLQTSTRGHRMNSDHLYPRALRLRVSSGGPG
jgi:hypothetical protein